MGLKLGISEGVLLRDHLEVDGITAEERAEWLIDYVISHQDDGRTELIRKAVAQFLAAETVAYERGRRT